MPKLIEFQGFFYALKMGVLPRQQLHLPITHLIKQSFIRFHVVHKRQKHLQWFSLTQEYHGALHLCPVRKDLPGGTAGLLLYLCPGI